MFLSQIQQAVLTHHTSTCSWLAADWSQTSAGAAPSPACWWTENSPEAGSLFETCGSAPGGGHSVRSRTYGATGSASRRLVTLASTTLSLRVCSAVCVRRFVPISSMVAAWLWTTCDGTLARSGFMLFWMTFSSCGRRRQTNQRVKLKKQITREGKDQKNKPTWTSWFPSTVYRNFLLLSSANTLSNARGEPCWVFPEAQHWNRAFWALKPPTRCIEFTKSNMNNQTFRRSGI